MLRLTWLLIVTGCGRYAFDPIASSASPTDGGGADGAGVACDLATGPRFYVAPGGADTNPGTYAAPFQTVAHGMSMLTPGTTLYVRDGTYVENLEGAALASGTSWSEPVTIAGCAGENVIFRPAAGPLFVMLFEHNSYIEVRNITLDAANVSVGPLEISNDTPPCAHHIRLTELALVNSKTDGLSMDGGPDCGFNEMVRLSIYDNTVAGIALKNTNNVIDGCDIYNNGAEGISLYATTTATDDNVIANNRVHNNVDGILVSSGNRNLVYNNLVWSHPNIGIRVVYNAPTDNRLFNNTVTANGEGFRLDSDAATTQLVNNISFGNGMDLNDLGTATITTTNAITINPQFVDAANGDFHVMPTSPAIDSGSPLNVVDRDIAGAARPVGSGYDIGAYER